MSANNTFSKTSKSKINVYKYKNNLLNMLTNTTFM